MLAERAAKVWTILFFVGFRELGSRLVEDMLPLIEAVIGLLVSASVAQTQAQRNSPHWEIHSRRRPHGQLAA